MKKNVKRKKGFTLIEIIIVISIIVVLAAIAVPKYASIQKDAKVKADIATAKTITDAVTVLIAQEKISTEIGSEASPVEITVAGTSDAAALNDAQAVALIGRYLQTIPTSAVYKDEKFCVSVDEGIATIYVYSDASTPVKTKVYPNGENPYAPIATVPE